MPEGPIKGQDGRPQAEPPPARDGGEKPDTPSKEQVAPTASPAEKTMPAPEGTPAEGALKEDAAEPGAAEPEAAPAAPEKADEPPAPAQEARPTPQMKEIVAPEAQPVAEQAAAQVPHLPSTKQVISGEGDTLLRPESMAIQWGEEAPQAGPDGKPIHIPLAGAQGEEAAQKEAVTWGEAAPPSAQPAGSVPAPPGPAPTAVAEPSTKAQAAPAPKLPVYPPLPPQFRGTLADISRFIRVGTFMFLPGGIVYLIFAVVSLGSAIPDSAHSWSSGRVGDDLIGGFLALLLAGASFLGFLLARRKLRGAFRRNDLKALYRRSMPAAVLGLIFGLVIGGVFLFLACVKVDELPGVHEKPAPVSDECAGQKAA